MRLVINRHYVKGQPILITLGSFSSQIHVVGTQWSNNGKVAQLFQNILPYLQNNARLFKEKMK